MSWNYSKINIVTLLQYNLYIFLVSPTTFISGFNFSHELSKPTCLPINISPSTLEGGSRMCGSVSIVLAKVLPNFLPKFFNPLVSTMHGIHANVKPCSSTLNLPPHFVGLEVTISTFGQDSWMGIEVFWDPLKNGARKSSSSICEIWAYRVISSCVPIPFK